MIIDFLKRSAKVAGLCLFLCPKGRKTIMSNYNTSVSSPVRGRITRKDGLPFTAKVTFWINKTDPTAKKTWEVDLKGHTILEMLDEVKKIEKNYPTTHGIKCSLWKVNSGPNLFIDRIADMKKSRREWAIAQAAGGDR